MNKLTVSIVTYNAGEDIKKCLESLKAQIGVTFDLIIVDNSSEDDTVRLAKSVMPKAEIIELSKNIGFGAGHNIAISRAKTEWILVLNQDVALEKDCLVKLFKASADRSVAAIGPLLYRNTKRDEIDTAGLEKTWYYKVFDRNKNYNSGYVWGISGACLLLKKDALKNSAHFRSDRNYPEYFDENFFMYKEDVDLAARLQRKGWRAYFVSDAVGYHQRTGRQAQNAAQTYQHRQALPDHVSPNSYKNHWYFLIKNVSLIALIPALIYEIGKFIYLLVFERKTLSALKSAFKNFKLMYQRRYA